MFWQLKETVVLADKTVEVSTVDLSLPEFGIHNKGFETCIYLPNDNEWEGEIVEWYATKEQAVEGHTAWSRPPVVGYVLAAKGK